MDPFTHALVGMAVSTAGQSKFDMLNPITTAAVLGSIMPDGDIILRLWGNSFYLKHHRGESHSIIGICIESLAAALILKLFYKSTPVHVLLLWVFLGALSHLVSDLLNSYGASIFWPFIKKKSALSLVAITDPFVIIFSLMCIFSSYRGSKNELYVLLPFMLYMLCKAAMRLWGYFFVKCKFAGNCSIVKIHILPAMIAIHRLHYIVETTCSNVVGELDFVFNSIIVRDNFTKIDDTLMNKILTTDVAEYFKEFTPIFHVDFEKVENGYIALLTDLRYVLKNKYLHHATITFDKHMSLIEQKFNPYNMNNRLDV